MKEKVFYIVNLDRKRIGVLALFLVGLLFSFFFLGVSVGKGNAMAMNTIDESNSSERSIVSPTQEGDSTQEKKGENSSEEVVLANQAPKSESSDKTDLPEAEVVDITSPGENVKRQENLHKDKPTPTLQKKSPKKLVSSSSKNLGAYTIQLVAFTQKSDADFFIRKLVKDNPGLRTRPFVKKSGKFYLVRIGASDNKDELKKLLSQLKMGEKIRKDALLVNNS